jgi:hypothetical protein
MSTTPCHRAYTYTSQMLTFIRQFVAGVFSETNMSTDPFLQLFDSPIVMDTQFFLTSFREKMLLSNHSPDAVIQRFKVKSLTLNKRTSSTTQHEYLSIEISDTQSQDTYARNYIIFLERTSSDLRFDRDSEDSDEYFSSHPDSAEICASISRALKDTPSFQSTLPHLTRADHIPLLPLVATSPGSLASPPPLQRSPSLSQLLDAASFSSGQLAHGSKTILAKSTAIRAQDQFLAGENARYTHGQGQTIRQLVPHDLSLFNLVVLANVVHEHHPVYSLLRRQCYWYANTIFEVISLSNACTILGAPTLEFDDVRIPPRLYLPDLAGRWMGLRISIVSAKIVELMKGKFEDRSARELTTVCFILHYTSSCGVTDLFCHLQLEQDWRRRHGIQVESETEVLRAANLGAANASLEADNLSLGAENERLKEKLRLMEQGSK